MAPRVLISDALSPAAVAIFKERGVEVDFQPALGKDKDKLAAIIGDYDGLAIRSATKVTAKILENAKKSARHRPRRHRRGQCRYSRRHRARRDRHEHALRQFHHHRRTRHRHDVRAGPPDSRRRRLDPGRQMGKEPLHGRRDHRQDARHHRLRQYRLDRRRPRARPENAGHRLRPLPVAGARQDARRGKGRSRRIARPRRFHHLAHAADRPDQEHPVGGKYRQGQERRADHQLRARRAGGRGRPAGGARIRPCRGRGLRRVRRGAGGQQSAVRPRKRRLHPASRGRHQRGAGKCRLAGRRADVGLSDPRRHFQRREFPLHHGRRGAAPETLHRAGGKARLLRRAADRGRRAQAHHHL